MLTAHDHTARDARWTLVTEPDGFPGGPRLDCMYSTYSSDGPTMHRCPFLAGNICTLRCLRGDDRTVIMDYLVTAEGDGGRVRCAHAIITQRTPEQLRAMGVPCE